MLPIISTSTLVTLMRMSLTKLELTSQCKNDTPSHLELGAVINHICKMGAGYNSLRRKKKKKQCKVGREEEGSTSNRPELAAFLLALRDTLIEEPLLYLCDNQSLLKTVNRWIGEGGKATLVGAAPGADILAAAIEILRKRIAAGTATFLVKVKAHRGEPANEGGNIFSKSPPFGRAGQTCPVDVFAQRCHELYEQANHIFLFVRCVCMHIAHMTHMIHITSTPATHDTIHRIHMNAYVYTKLCTCAITCRSLVKSCPHPTSFTHYPSTPCDTMHTHN